jgi:hypothetical protein
VKKYALYFVYALLGGLTAIYVVPWLGRAVYFEEVTVTDSVDQAGSDHDFSFALLSAIPDVYFTDTYVGLEIYDFGPKG